MTDILKGIATDQEAKNRLLSRTPLRRIGDAGRGRGDRGVPRLG